MGAPGTQPCLAWHKDTNQHYHVSGSLACPTQSCSLLCVSVHKHLYPLNCLANMKKCELSQDHPTSCHPIRQRYRTRGSQPGTQTRGSAQRQGTCPACSEPWAVAPAAMDKEQQSPESTSLQAMRASTCIPSTREAEPCGSL